MKDYLKTWPRYFERIRNDEKYFEIRNNDRDFQSGDEVVLEEYDPETESYSKRKITATIGYILRDHDGMYSDYVIFQLRGVSIND